MKCIIIGMLAETPVHPGAGRSTGFVDLPVARESITEYPVIVGSSLKGAIKDRAREKWPGKKEEMGNATSIFNLVRNLGGSFGVAFVTTLLARRAQVHQLRFGEHLNVFDPKYQLGVHKAMAVLQSKGVAAGQAANGIIYQRLLRESNMAAFTDAFYLSTVIMLCVLPLIFLFKRPKAAEAAAL